MPSTHVTLCGHTRIAQGCSKPFESVKEAELKLFCLQRVNGSPEDFSGHRHLVYFAWSTSWAQVEPIVEIRSCHAE